MDIEEKQGKQKTVFEEMAERLQDGWPDISFMSVLDWLCISDYKDKIYTFDENGDLFHCYTYMAFAKFLRDSGYDGKKFREWFLYMEEEFLNDDTKNVNYVYWYAPKFFMSYLKMFKEIDG